MNEHILADEKTMDRMLMRLSHEIIENNVGAEELYLVGIRRRGVPLAERIKANIERFSYIRVHLGALDITLYRDDLKELFPTPQVHGTDIDPGGSAGLHSGRRNSERSELVRNVIGRKFADAATLERVRADEHLPVQEGAGRQNNSLRFKYCPGNRTDA